MTGRDVVDSIRNPAEVEELREEPGFILLAVEAPVEIRFARAVARARPGDGLTLEEFRAKEARENSPDPTRQQLVATFAMADRTLRNEGSVDQLRAAVDAALEDLTTHPPR